MLRILFYLFSAVYPVLVFCFLVIFKIPPRYFSVFVIFAASAAFIGATSKKKNLPRLCGAALLAAAGLACLLSNSALFLKLYPVLMNAVMLGSFGFTLFAPPPMIFRFATLADSSIRGSLGEKQIEGYCKKVTLVWCVFFVLNGGAAAWTVLSGSDLIWSVYNGGISYILIGILFAGEFAVRKMTQKKTPKAIPLSAFTLSSRPADYVLCYDRFWRKGDYKTWKDFLEDTARLRLAIDRGGQASWILHAEDCWYFLCAFTALLQCGKEIRLTANISPGYIAEIRGKGGTAFLTDQKLDREQAAGETVYIPALLEGPALSDSAKDALVLTAPAVRADETVILMYTSGSTGAPKVVAQRLTEFETDNRFILSKWGAEWLSRKVCATVSQHHIYGLLFGILLPFTAGVPFRRRRIETPEEFETLRDDPLMIVTVPAFLKRAAAFAGAGESGGEVSFGLKDPWIFTSGGVLERDLAEKTRGIFGFWPLEVYGSTETSGIAWRQSLNGPEWTPFDNAEIRLNGEGCLVIRSPYIKDPGGFVTADMAELLPDGRFLLLGRSDSVVKIEEKRISLFEVEARLLQSGLAADVCVIAMREKRQYLAAALVLNEEGNARFRDCPKFEINRCFRDYLLRFFEPVVLPRRWRYVQSIPLDSQGKKKRAAMEALFGAGEGAEGSLPAARLLERSETKALLEFTMPRESDYFDGHFPAMPILPAVAQAELAIRFASRYLGTSPLARRLKRLKFSALVRPGTVLRLELSREADSQGVSFSFTSPDGKTRYSAGSFIAWDGE